MNLFKENANTPSQNIDDYGILKKESEKIVNLYTMVHVYCYVW